MDKLVLQLYRSLRRKANYACSQQKHLFRFQVQPNPELWGKGLMFDPLYDKRIIQSIFPPSVYPFIENDIPFSPNAYSSESGKQRLFNDYLPTLSSDPSIDASKINKTVGAYPISDEQRVIADETEVALKISSDPTNDSSALADNMRVSEYDSHRLSRLLYHIFDKYRLQANIDQMNRENAQLNQHSAGTQQSIASTAHPSLHKSLTISRESLIADGFAVLKALDEQIEINQNTSISEASGVRVIATSRYIPALVSSDPAKPYAFAYRIRIENHGKQWLQLLGRHWIIQHNNGKTDVLERFQPGVVGLQPPLESGQIFIYGSGVFLETDRGEMGGSLQFTNISGDLFEVPIANFRLKMKHEEEEGEEDSHDTDTDTDTDPNNV